MRSCGGGQTEGTAAWCNTNRDGSSLTSAPNTHAHAYVYAPAHPHTASRIHRVAGDFSIRVADCYVDAYNNTHCHTNPASSANVRAFAHRYGDQYPNPKPHG